jgi:hypothetical protein
MKLNWAYTEEWVVTTVVEGLIDTSPQVNTLPTWRTPTLRLNLSSPQDKSITSYPVALNFSNFFRGQIWNKYFSSILKKILDILKMPKIIVSLHDICRRNTYKLSLHPF